MSAIKVVFLQPNMTLGGAERQAYSLMTSLDKQTFTPMLVCLSIKGEFYEKTEQAGIPSWFLGVRGRLPVSGLWRLIRLLRDVEPDLLVARGFSATVLGRIACRFAGRIPVLVHEHASEQLMYRSWTKRVLDRMLVPLTAGWIGVAESQREYLTRRRHLPNARIHVIHNGVPEAPSCDSFLVRDALGLSRDAFVCGTIATMRAEKDLPAFVRAATILSERVPEAMFVIVGDGPQRTEVEDAIDSSGISERFVLCGAVSDIDNVMPSFDVFTLSSWSETFPMTILEAMSYAKPVVATDVGGVSEAVRDGVTGFLVTPRDPSSVADRWLRLYEDPSLRESMGLAGRDRQRSEFSVDASTRRYEALFESFVVGGRC